MANVLLIEPDNVLAKIYAAALSEAGHNVVVKHTAQTAVREADENRPEIVLLELLLPGHGAIEFLHEFRSYPEWQQVPVMLHTLIPIERLQAQLPRFSQLGIVKYLYKPTTNLRQLSRSVGEVLQPV